MRIKWEKDTELVVHENKQEHYTEQVKAGDFDDVKVHIDINAKINLEFACGDMAYDVPYDCFMQVPEGVKR